MLDLRREVDCAPGADHGPVPRELVVEADDVGRVVVQTIDVGPDQEAYGAVLDGAPRDACAAHGGPLLGPLEDVPAVEEGERPSD